MRLLARCPRALLALMVALLLATAAGIVRRTADVVVPSECYSLTPDDWFWWWYYGCGKDSSGGGGSGAGD